MKVVIEIPDIFVEWAKDEMSVEIFNDRSMADAMCSAIRNGIVLPSGHGRLIDADSVIKYWKPDHSRQFVADYFIHTLEVADTVIPADKEDEDDGI